MTSEKRFEPLDPGDFWSQAPVVLFAGAAVLAILFVNVRTQAANLPAPAAAAASKSARTGVCRDCGVVIAVESAAVPGAEDKVTLAVQMADGKVLAVRQVAPGLAVGDPVRVSNNVLTAGN